MAERRLVRVGEAKRLLGCSDTTVYRYADLGLIAEWTNPVTGSKRYVLSSIEAFIAANTTPARPHVVEVTPAPKRRKPRSSAGARAAVVDWGDRGGLPPAEGDNGAEEAATTRTTRGSRTGS